MAQSRGPHTPKNGWEKRWLGQALELLLRTPAILVVHAASVLFAGAAFAAIKGQGILTVLMLCALAACPIVAHGLATWFIARADGRCDASLETLVVRLKPMVGTAFVGVFALAAVGIMMSGMIPNAPADPETPPRQAANSLVAIARMGLFIHTGIYAGLSVVSLLWLPAIASLQMTLSEARHVQRSLFNMPMAIWLSMIMVALYGVDMFAGVHPIAGLLALCLRDAWFYVAAREIVGGLDDNGHPASETALQTS